MGRVSEGKGWTVRGVVVFGNDSARDGWMSDGGELVIVLAGAKGVVQLNRRRRSLGGDDTPRGLFVARGSVLNDTEQYRVSAINDLVNGGKLVVQLFYAGRKLFAVEFEDHVPNFQWQFFDQPRRNTGDGGCLKRRFDMFGNGGRGKEPGGQHSVCQKKRMARAMKNAWSNKGGVPREGEFERFALLYKKAKAFFIFRVSKNNFSPC